MSASKTPARPKGDDDLDSNSNASQPFDVKTSPPQRPDATPRLPHERDESEDSQAAKPGPARDDIKQAYRDLQEGQVDTDLRNQRGIDAVVNNPPGPSPINPRDEPGADKDEKKTAPDIKRGEPAKK